MKRKTIGEVLRDTRELHGWSLKEVQYMTNIPSKFIQALEYNDFDIIPDEVYIRVFLEHYAETLNLDAKVILDAYDTNSMLAYYMADEVAESDASQVGFDFGTQDLISKTGKKVSQKQNSPKKPNMLPIMYLSMFAAAIVIFISYVVYNQAQELRLETSASYRLVNRVSADSKIESTISSSTSASTSTSSSTASSNQSENTTLTTSGGGNSLVVEVKKGTADSPDVTLSFTVSQGQQVWLSVSETDLSDGSVIEDARPSVSTSLTSGVTSAVVTLGYVPAVTMTINGQTVDLSSITETTAEIIVNIVE